MAIEEIVKLCSPLNHLVTSLGLLPKAWANCFFVNPRLFIKYSIRAAILNDSLVLI